MAKPYDTTPNRLLSLPRSKVRADPLRKKACTACARSKAKCDHSRPTCSRCALRSVECQYGVTPSQRANLASDTGPIDPSHSHSGWDDGPVNHLGSISNPNLIPGKTREHVNALHFPSPDSSSTPIISHLVSLQDELLPLPTPGRISFRWLATMLPPPLPKAKHFSPLAIHICKSFLRTIPLRLVSHDPPPFVHATQLSLTPCEPLANAITITRMWYERAGGSEDLVSRTIASEMESIVRKRESYDAPTSLAAFQSYLILAILSYLHISIDTITLDTLLNLQSLSDRAISTSGLICRPPSPGSGKTVSQGAYIHAEALRRSIFLACVFDDVYNTEMGLPIFVAEDLERLPAPGPRGLWGATSEEWPMLWEQHARQWDTTTTAGASRSRSNSGSRTDLNEDVDVGIDVGSLEPGLLLHELWSGESSPAWQARFDRWLSEADEYGMWIFTVCELAGNGRANQS